MELSVDPLWPRAGDWPALSAQVDVALLGLGTHATSLSPTRAFETPAAIRAAMRFYSDWFAPLGDASSRWGQHELAGRAGDASSRLGQHELASPRRQPGSQSGAPMQAARALTRADAGDFANPDGDEVTATAVVARAAALARLLVVLGGDNAATVPAAIGTWGSRIDAAGLITLDAHHDVRDGRSNGSPVRRLIEAGLDGRRIVQIGIADFANSTAYSARARDFGITVIHRNELLSRSMSDAMAEALEIAGAAGGPVHVDLDVDVCDRAVAPACPAAVPGGISALELRTAARVAGRHPLVESIDLTEVDAAADTPDKRTVRLAALCVLEAAAGLAERA